MLKGPKRSFVVVVVVLLVLVVGVSKNCSITNKKCSQQRSELRTQKMFAKRFRYLFRKWI